MQSSHNRLDFKPLPAIKLKGLVNPIAVYQPTGQKQERLHPRMRTRSSDKNRLIGRQPEVNLLQNELQAVQRGLPGRTIIIDGEAGIGKTRLVEELIYQAQEAGLSCLIGIADAIEKSTAYYAWRDIFNRLFGIEAISDLDMRRAYLQRLANTYLKPSDIDLAPLFNDVLPLGLPENDRTRKLSGQYRADQTREVIANLIANIAENGTPSARNDHGLASTTPMLFIIEDAQYLDSASWALALEISQLTQPILLVIVTRTLPDPHPLEYTQLLQQDSMRYLQLNALSLPNALQLVCQRLGVTALPEPVANLISLKAEGHPFFSEQLAYSLRDAELIKIEDGVCQLPPYTTELNELDFPHTIRGVITSRIDRLSPEQQLMLKVASVIGRTFPYQILHDIHPPELDKTYLADGLQALARLDITPLQQATPQLSYGFKHISTQEVAYDLMLFSQRRQLHQAVAEWYESRYADDLPTHYPLLAHHWSKAVGDQPTETPLGLAKPEAIKAALHYLTKAGEQALRTNVNQEAIDFFSRAIAILKPLPEMPNFLQQELGLLIKLGNPLIAVKGYAAPEVRQTYNRARSLCQQLGDQTQEFFILQGLLGLHFSRANLATALDLAREMLSLAQSSEDEFLLLKAHYGLGHTLLAQGQLSEASEHLQIAISLYEPDSYQQRRADYPYQGVDPGVGAQAHQAMALWYQGQFEQAKSLIQQTLDLAEGLGHPVSLALAAGYAAILYQRLGESELVQRWTNRLLALSEKRDFAFWAVWGNVMRPWTWAEQGQITQAIEALEIALADHEEIGAGIYRPLFMTHLAEMIAHTGDPRRGLCILDDTLALIDETGERIHLAEIYRLKGILLLQLDPPNPGQAEACFNQALTVAQGQQARATELRAATYLSRLWQEQGKLENAQQVLAEIYDHFSDELMTIDVQAAQAQLGLLEVINVKRGGR